MNIKDYCTRCDGVGFIDDIDCTQCTGTGYVDRALEDAMREACELDDKIKALTAEHIEPLQVRLDVLKMNLSAAVREAGETIKTPYGRIEYVRASERVSWDDRALLSYAVEHTEILSLRTTKEVAPGARIKFEVKPS